VERFFAWLNGFRRITQRFERYAFMYEAFLHLACAWICLRRLLKGVLGPVHTMGTCPRGTFESSPAIYRRVSVK
jgi:hypothetical protein